MKDSYIINLSPMDRTREKVKSGKMSAQEALRLLGKQGWARPSFRRWLERRAR